MDDMPAAAGAATEEGAGQGAGAQAPAKPAAPSAEERLGRLYADVGPSVRRILDAVLEGCREPRDAEGVEGLAAPAREGVFTVYSTATLCGLLVEAGGLERIEPQGEGAELVEVDGAEYVEPAGGAREPLFRTTPAGLSRLEQEGGLGAFEELLGEDARYRDVYRALLDLCSNDDGASAKEMGDAVDGWPELQEPRMFAPYFFNRLAECGALEWSRGAWRTTALGRRAAEGMDDDERRAV